MSSSFSLKNISKYRTHMFAIAIAMVVLHHLSFKYDVGVIGKAYSFFRVTGAFGVDIFLFLSGLGCYYSFSKDEKILDFYRRRLIRLLPAYLIVAIVAYYITDIVINGSGILIYFSNVTLIAFWINGGSDWYIAAALFLYLLFPLIYYCINTIKKGYIILFAVWCVVCGLVFVIDSNYFSLTSRLWARIPVFIFGVLLAPKIKEGYEVKNTNTLLLISLIVNIVSLLLEAILALKGSEYAYSFLARLIYCPLAISFVFIISYIFSVYKLSVIKKGLFFGGGITLEIYMLNQRIIDLCTYFGTEYVCSKIMFILLWNILGVALTVVLSWGLHLMVDWVIHRKNIGLILNRF